MNHAAEAVSAAATVAVTVVVIVAGTSQDFVATGLTSVRRHSATNHDKNDDDSIT